jgi:hypothetical protein
MSTLQIVSNARLVDDQLDLSQLSVTIDAAPLDVLAREALGVFREARILEVSLPEAGTLQIRVVGFTSGGHNYAIEATSRFETEAAVTWSRDGADAVSPTFSAEGTYVLDVAAVPGDPTAGRRPTTVSVKIRKPGKPDEFLTKQFPPQ